MLVYVDQQHRAWKQQTFFFATVEFFLGWNKATIPKAEKTFMVTGKTQFLTFGSVMNQYMLQAFISLTTMKPLLRKISQKNWKHYKKDP